jgi:hypothetical protein
MNLQSKIQPPLYKCYKNQLIKRCQQRGYTFAEVANCVLYEEQDQLIVDTSHEDYPMLPKEPESEYEEIIDKTQPPLKKIPKEISTNNVGGAGTELKKLLKMIGITASPTCSCNAKAKTMDEKGIEWCEQNIETIVSWLKEEATKRKLPFIDMAGRILVKKAIRNAKKIS